jgi:hypothetical protein
MARWDSFWYHSVAEVGYGYSEGSQFSFAFFPGYPMAMWLVGSLVGDFYLGGILVSAGLGLVTLYLFRAWLVEVAPSQKPSSALVALAFGPSAFYLMGIAYAESMFLASTIGAFLMLERGRPIRAGLLGAVAAVTRPVGVAVVVGLALRAMELQPAPPDGVKQRQLTRFLRGRRAAVLLPLVGLAAYPLYLWVTQGDPLVFMTAGAEGWGHGINLDNVFKFGEFGPEFSSRYRAVVAVQAAMLVVSMVVLPSIRRSFGRSYMIYTLIAVLLPALVRPTVLGIGRYVLVAFPVFAIASRLLDRDLPRARWGVFALSVGFLVFQYSLFARWYFVG